jgi:hypothetical protein
VICEVRGVCIKTGFNVWINELFVRSTNDATIVEQTLDGLLAEDEGMEVDQGYAGDSNKLKSPQLFPTTTTKEREGTSESMAWDCQPQVEDLQCM